MKVIILGASRLLPDVINAQQYQLLFEDNIADASALEKIIGRRVRSSKAFFTKEFQHA